MKMDKYQELLRLLFDASEHFPKKHGHWCRFQFPREGTFMEVDTWNGRICYRKGDGEYDYWNGFRGDLVYDLGCRSKFDDLLYRPLYRPYSPNVYQHFIDKVERSMYVDYPPQALDKENGSMV